MTRATLAILAAVATLILPSAAQAALPSIQHVFVIVLENESAATTFGPGSPAPYLAGTLRPQGAYLPNYYGIGHQSNDNYIAMISGQAPNVQTQADCQNFDDLQPGTIGPNGQAIGSGCIYPANVPTLPGQLTGAGLTWRSYNEDMGNDPAREPSFCAHPGVNTFDNTQKAEATDSYATRHNPFVYFHSIIDDTTLCDTHVVNFDFLARDLSSAADTPSYSFITPNLCNDGHDAPCAAGQPGGLAQADSFLRTWVPRITESPAFRNENGLLIITFDEAATSDSSSCCGEIPGPGSPAPGDTGPGGGDVGAVLLSPCIAPGTVSTTAYNHYTMLRSVEDVFGLPHIGYAGLSGATSFGSDIFTRACNPAPPGSGTGGPGAGLGGSGPPPRLHAPALASRASATPRVNVSWSAPGAHNRFTLQVRRTSGRRHAWRTLLRSSARRSLSFRGAAGVTYQFRLRAIRARGPSPWATATTVSPTGTRIAGGRFHGSWRRARVRDAWLTHAMTSARRGSTFTLTYTGDTLTVIGDRWPQGGRVRITVDGRARTINLHSARPHARQALFRAAVPYGRHHMTIRVLRGVAAIEGLGISDWSR